MRIGFYGDSFCETYDSDSVEWHTYIRQIADNYGIKRNHIVNFGVPGCSFWDTILLQFGYDNSEDIEYKTFPDLMIFVWTDPNRLFNRTIRSLNRVSAFDLNKMTKNYPNNMDIVDSAQKYYTHLLDPAKDDFSYEAALSFFDREVLSKISNRCKIIHMWSFFKPTIAPLNYYYRWQNGVEIRPPLIKLSLLGVDKDKHAGIFQNDTRKNHIDGSYNNSLLANTIISAIDNYENGKLIMYL